MKLYLSGPMSRMPSFNIPAFDHEAARLRSLGHEIVSPAELDEPEFRQACLDCVTGDADELGRICADRGLVNESWGALLARDVRIIGDEGIEGVVVLPGWTKSKGALLETYVARLVGIPIFMDAGPGLGLVALPSDLIEAEHAHAAGHINGANVARKIQEGTPTNLNIQKALDDAGEKLIHYTSQEEADLLHHVGRSGMMGEVRTVDPETGGEKGEKPEAYDLIPWESLDEVARLYAAGAKKYAPHNWRKGFRWGLCFASLIRHARKWWAGETLDPETKCHHLASVVFHALTLMEFERAKLGKDDRALH